LSSPTRVAVMSQGKIEQVGTPDDVYHRPETAFVYEFMGNVNRFDCRIQEGQARVGPLVSQRRNSPRPATSRAWPMSAPTTSPCAHRTSRACRPSFATSSPQVGSYPSRAGSELPVDLAITMLPCLS